MPCEDAGVADTTSGGDLRHPDGPRDRAEQEGGDPRSSFLGAIISRLSAVLRRWNAGSLREEIEEILATPESDAGEDALPAEARLMLRNILQFGDLSVDDIMVPRANIVAVEQGLTLNELVRVFEDAQHSRLPVYADTLDHPVGMVHVKDIIGLLAPGAPRDVPFDLKRHLREVLYVPTTMPVFDLLLKMQQTQIHLALVIDEYGGTEGLVSLEDLVEQIVGEIEDEHDTDEDPIMVERGPDLWEIDARVPIEDLEERLGAKLLDADLEEEVDTAAGLVTALAGRMPKIGERVVHPAGFAFEVLDADPRRLTRLRVRKTDAESAPETAGAIEGSRAR